MHDSSIITLIIFGLVALNALSYYSERLMLFPSVIWVLCLGMIYRALNYFEQFHLPELYLDPNIILFMLFPVLIFAATKKMCLHHFRKVLKESSILATLGIVISTAGVALILLLPNDFSYKPLFLTIAFVMVIVSLVAYPFFLKKILEDKPKA